MPPKKKVFVLKVPKEIAKDIQIQDDDPSSDNTEIDQPATSAVKNTKKSNKRQQNNEYNKGNVAKRTRSRQQKNKNKDTNDLITSELPSKSSSQKKQKTSTDSSTKDTPEIIDVDSDITSHELQADINSTNTVISYSNQKQFNIDKNNMKSSDENFSVTGQTFSDNEDESNIPLSEQQPKFPSQFHNMTNEFEIALWLAYHQRILNLAISIRNGMSTRVNEEECETSLISNLSHEAVLQSGLSLPEIDQEECKALFLRTRNNTVALYEELVVRVCKITKTDPRLGTLVKDVVEPYDELDEFITEDVWRQLFQMHLRATDQQKLRKDSEIITNLGIFVRHVVKAILIAQRDKEDTQAVVKKCDENTIDLPIPTKLGIVK
ncbi:877_t:CDS:2, partial [Rhizophagus irregularis]